MIFDDQMLEAAAKEVSDSLVAAAEALPQEEHTFSADFEKKMDRLLQKKEFPWRRVAVAVVAVLTLIVMIVCATFSSAIDVRAGDDASTYGVLCGYVRRGRTEECTLEELPDFELTYVPEGYSLKKVSKCDEWGFCQYGSDNKKYIRFSYCGTSDSINWISYNANIKYVCVPFGNTSAHLYLDESRYGTSTIVWIDPETNILFKISFDCNREELLRLATGVRKIEKNK